MALKCLVCGMNINDKNYMINKSTCIEENRKGDINNCPFCGANNHYIAIDKEVYTTEGMVLSESELKILDSAMKLEKFNAEFYLTASTMTNDSKVSEFFKELSSIELMHARVHMRMGGFEELPKLHQPDYSRFNSDRLLLDAANKREKHAIDYYKGNMNRVNDVMKDVFRALIDVEQQHEILTK